jgi:outer membrane receptor protein involved in Fe transport
MASDPPLDQVVAKTFEVGTRGKLLDNMGFSASVYQTKNHNDIQFIASDVSSGLGYFDNISRTKRSGLDLGLNGQLDKLNWRVGYSYVRAQYDSDFEMPAEFNSTMVNDEITVKKGAKMPGVPEHQLKLRAQYAVTPDWTIGTNIVAFSSQYVRGNENNKHVANTADCLASNGTTLRGNDQACGSGKISGYTVVNLDTQYNIGGGWKAFAKAINIFDQNYNIAGRLAETMFDASGNYGGEIKSLGLLPGAPRAGWIGVRYEFGGAPEAK